MDNSNLFERYNGTVEQLKEWNEAYRGGNPLVPDYVYDELLETLPENHPYRNSVEPEKLYKGRIKHDKPMLSMQKTKTKEGMERWVEGIRCAIYDLGLDPRDIDFRATAKLDGIAGRRDGHKFVTRGDGQYGNDVSDCEDKGVVVSYTQSEHCLGEFVIKKDYFQENLSKEFTHPRNFVSGAIMSDTLNSLTGKAFKDKAIVFQAYHELPHISYSILNLLEDFREIERDISDSVNYQIDGVIFEILNDKVKEYMGETEHHPNWAIALKPEDKKYYSTIAEIKWQTGRTGKVTPVVIIEPVIIDGVEVRRATAHNAKNVLDMGLRPNVKIELIRSGSVIPYIVRTIKGD